ncbi:zf-HC2 domain-containing protein [bacterium]|nr:zf-HC2 domain-containing protein [bacterium]
MICRDFQSRISAYVEEEQDKDVERLMDAHLKECPGCVEALNGVRGIRARLGRQEQVRPSPDFTFAVRGKLLMEAARSRGGLTARITAWLFPTVPRTMLAGAFAVVMVAGLALIVNGPNRPFSTPKSHTQNAGEPPPSQVHEIPSHYVLERIPSSSRRGMAISSRAYKTRGDTLSVPHGGRTANVQYVRF